MLLAGRYRIVRPIHRGGMGEVFLAEDLLQRGEHVVLKGLRLPEGATAAERQEAEAWFAREAYLLSNLHSPLIPQFYGAFREGGRSYIVQEYVAGENLDRVVSREGPLPEELVLEWGVALCALLGYLHEQAEPVIYRDLKPANLLWRDGAPTEVDGYPLAVVDFGIARPYRRGEVGTVIGTPGYAPPEQYQGLATPQSDIYALGATLHRLLTGYDPERGAPFTFPPVRQLNPAVSPEVAAVVERAVQLDPAARFESAEAMGAALRRVAWGQGYAQGLVGVAARSVQPYAASRSWIGPAIAALMVGPLLASLVTHALVPPDPGPMSYQPIPVVMVPMPDGSGGLVGPAWHGWRSHHHWDQGAGPGSGQVAPPTSDEDGDQP
jgi:serine/threonine-protein kinase